MSNVPKLRFKEFNGEWEEKKLGNLTTLMQSGLSRLLSDSDIGLPVIRSNNMVNGKLDVTDIKYWYKNDTQGAKTENYFLKENDLLVNFINSLAQIGKVVKYENLLNRDVIFTTNIMRLRFKEDINSSFIFNFCHTKKYENYIQTITKPAVNQASFTTKDFNKLFIYLPSKQEQEKIASFLISADTKIEQLTKQEQLLQQYKKGVMQKIFNQEIRFKADDGSEFPNWEEKKLGEISDVRDGTHDSPKYHDIGYPLITSKNLLTNGNIDFVNINLILEEDYINVNKRSKVNIGDILFGMIGTIGNPVIVKQDGFAIKNVALIKEKEILLNNFLIHYLKSSFIEKQFYEQNTGGTQKFIALGIIRELIIILPCLTEQTKIANFLSSIDKKIELTTKELNSTKEFKKALLQQMFI